MGRYPDEAGRATCATCGSVRSGGNSVGCWEIREVVRRTPKAWENCDGEKDGEGTLEVQLLDMVREIAVVSVAEHSVVGNGRTDHGVFGDCKILPCEIGACKMF